MAQVGMKMDQSFYLEIPKMAFQDASPTVTGRDH